MMHIYTVYVEVDVVVFCLLFCRCMVQKDCGVESMMLCKYWEVHLTNTIYF